MPDWRQITPSTGRSRKVSAPNLNAKGYKAGQRVLFEALGLHVDTIDVAHNSGCTIDCFVLPWTNVLGVVPARVDDAQAAKMIADIEELRESTAAEIRRIREAGEREERRILRKAGVR